jgi:hypothetical protein
LEINEADPWKNTDPLTAKKKIVTRTRTKEHLRKFVIIFSLDLILAVISLPLLCSFNALLKSVYSFGLLARLSLLPGGCSRRAKISVSLSHRLIGIGVIFEFRNSEIKAGQ